MVSGCEGSLDVVFILDSSGSIGLENFQHIKQFVINVIRMLDIERDRIHVGMVQFSSEVNAEGSYKLNSFRNREQAVKAVQDLE